MPTMVLNKPVGVRELLDRACARNANAELHYDQGGDLRTAKVRLLAVGENVVVADRPQNIDREVQLYKGQKLTVYIQLEGERWAFQTKVANERQIVRLNASRRVMGMSMDIPTIVREQQRRRDFRLPTVALGIPVTIFPTSPAYPLAVEWSAPIWTAKVANISARGAGLLVDTQEHLEINRHDKWFLHLKLIEDHEPLLLLGEVRHFSPVPDRPLMMVGMGLEPHPQMDERTIHRTLTAFITWRQRRKLKRAR